MLEHEFPLYRKLCDGYFLKGGGAGRVAGVLRAIRNVVTATIAIGGGT